MISRRSFLWTSTAAAALAHAPRLLAQRSGGTTPAALPPSIQALTSMRDKARPITADERRGRVERARKLMADQKMNALVLCSGTSLVYFTNISWSGGERLFACVIPVTGEPFFVCPAFEEARARELIRFTDDVRVWQEDESPYRLLAGVLRDRGAAAGQVGIEERLRFFILDRLQADAPQLRCVRADAVTTGCRAVKSPAELALLQRANDITAAAFRAVLPTLEEGMTQGVLEARMTAALARAGGSSPWALAGCRKAVRLIRLTSL